MKKVFYTLVITCLLTACNEADKATTYSAKTATITEVLIGKSAETVTVMQVIQQGETTTVKWKNKPKAANDEPVSFRIMDENITSFDKDGEETVVNLIVNQQYYYIPANNPASPVSIMVGSGGHTQVRIKCKCTILASMFGGKCKGYGYVVNNNFHAMCDVDDACLFCEAEVTFVEKVVTLGSGLLIKAPSINVVPL